MAFTRLKYYIKHLIPDSLWLRYLYRRRLGKWLNLKNPQTFNEKLQWLKLHDRKPEYTTMVDKYAVKQYVADKIGEQYIIPTLGVWNKFDDIDFDSLPNQFVLKCTHDSGGLVIVRDKANFDKDAARKKLTKCLKRNFYWHGREWPYKNVKPRILAEKYMEDGGKVVPEDYKIYCMNGEPKYVVVFHNRFNEGAPLSETVYDTDWNVQPFSLDDHFAVSDIVEPKPDCLDDLLRVCRVLCKDIAQVRVDFYIINKEIYFGEITLSTASGFRKMIPEEMDRILGEQLRLPKVENGGGYYLSDEYILHVDGIIRRKTCLLDYKLMCFNGICKYIFTVTNRFSEEGLNVTWFDTLWNKQPFERHYKADPAKIKKPQKLEEMIAIAEKLSKQISFDRIDLYEIDGRIYFGEITFYPGSGFEEFSPEKYDGVLGDCIQLPSANGGGYVCIDNGYILWLHQETSPQQGGLTDYKFYCFEGVVKALLVASGRNESDGVKMDFFDAEFRPIAVTSDGHPHSTERLERPESFLRMREIASELSKGIPFLRTDFYEVGGKLYFGELTFYPVGGFRRFEPEEWDRIFGGWLKLPEDAGGGYICVGDGFALYFHCADVIHKKSLTDYKFYCFNGEPKFLYISEGLENHNTARISFLTMDWQFAPYERSDFAPFETLPPKPHNFDEMLAVAKKLAAHHAFLRVDVYEINGNVYFSELTFSPCSGVMPFKNPDHDSEIGMMLELPIGGGYICVDKYGNILQIRRAKPADAVDLKDYKIFCFNGEPKLIEVDYDRFTNHKRNLYTTSWEYLPFSLQYPTDATRQIAKPDCLDELLRLARILSADIPFVRADFYIIDGRIYFGEMTFFHGAGTEKFYPDSWDKTLGDWLKFS